MNPDKKQEAKRIKSRHMAKMLSDLEAIGNIAEVDKTVIKQNLSNYASDIQALYEQEVSNESRFNR